MITTAFRKAYAKLNPRQKEAVDAIDGPVMVVAGPGTGKTQVLTLRIANILANTDTEPRSILALTFTEKAAFNMRARLAEIIGEAAYGIRIGTFHAFCNEIIGRSPDSFPHIIGGTPLADGEQLEIVEALLESDDIDLLRPAGRPESYVRSIVGAIGDIKGKGYDPKRFATAVAKAETGEREADRRKTIRMAELANIYMRYEKELARTNRYDYADMLVHVATALEKDSELRLDLAEQYQYVLVDEHQDTNRTQNRIIQLIAEHNGSPNLFVVGDLEQAVYRFQGASPENFRDFAKRYSDCRVIHLDDNYRSSQIILDAAAGISPSQGPLSAKIKHRSEPIRLYALSSPGVMEYAAAELAAQAIKQGTPPGRIAVLYRKNREADGLAAAMECLGIACAVQSDQEVLGDRWIMKLLTIARAAHHIGDSAALLEVIHVDLIGISPLDAAKIGQEARIRRMNPWDIIRSRTVLKRLAVEDAESIISAYAMLKKLAGTLANTDAATGLERVVEESGWIPATASLRNGHEAVAKLRALFDAVRAYVAGRKKARLGDFLDSLDRIERHDSDLSALARAREDAVQLMTVHKAKGLEFDLVIIANAVRGHWDDARKPAALPLPSELAGDDPNSEEDVRRLFYVAATRARTQLAILWSQKTVDGKDLEPSRFVLAIPEKLKYMADTLELEKSYIRHMSGRIGSRRTEPMLRQKEYIADLLEHQPLSITALNNFLQCPWRYYFSNLVRIPEAPAPKSEYGTAAHQALRIFFDQRTAGEKPSKSSIVASFRTALSRAPLAPHVIAQLDRQGSQALAGWHDFWKTTWPTAIRSELVIDRIELAPGVVLTGKLDKVEMLSGNRVNVVDYKTKEPMSANAIRGLTASSTGNEYRQLLFYKILLDRQGAWDMASGQIDFLEPNASAKYKKELFPIDTAMTQELQATIKDVVDRIRNLSFWDKRCGERNCRYCRIRTLMT
jgi:DNA helicase-2/ATP-dependent DNA helicase PcrA